MIDMRLRLIICQMVLGASLMLDPAYPTHALGLAMISFGATGIYNTTTKLFKDLRSLKSNDPKPE